MKSLTCIKIDGGCSKLVVFPQGVLPNTHTYLCIRNLPNLINLGEGLHSLISLKKLKIKHCKKLNKLLPKEGFPLKLQSLFITDCESILPSTEWGLHGMKSLAHFMTTGRCSTMELFPERGLLLDSLTSLCISRLPDLKYLVNGLQHLTSLKKLEIDCRKKLELIQAKGLPASLSSLRIRKCSLLALRCEKDGGEDL